MVTIGWIIIWVLSLILIHNLGYNDGLYDADRLWGYTPHLRSGIQSDPGPRPTKPHNMLTEPKPSRQADEALSLVDGVYEIVEIYKPDSPAGKDWKTRWLKRANKLGIYGE